MHKRGKTNKTMIANKQESKTYHPYLRISRYELEKFDNIALYNIHEWLRGGSFSEIDFSVPNGYLSCSNCPYMGKIQEGLTFGNLFLTQWITSLPKNLTVKGNMELRQFKLKDGIPVGISIGGSIAVPRDSFIESNDRFYVHKNALITGGNNYLFVHYPIYDLQSKSILLGYNTFTSSEEMLSHAKKSIDRTAFLGTEAQRANILKCESRSIFEFLDAISKM